MNGNAGATDVTALDPNYRPERTDNLTVSLQRQLGKNMTMEVGYIGRTFATSCWRSTWTRFRT